MSAQTKFLEAAAAADRAADAVGTEAELAETMKVLRYMEEIEIALVNQAVARSGPRTSGGQERLPLRESGDDFGRIEARIPKNLAFRFMKQRNFGEDGFYSDEGMRDFLKAFPQYRVKTVSGKTVVGFAGRPRRGKAGAVFGRGVLNLAT